MSKRLFLVALLVPVAFWVVYLAFFTKTTVAPEEGIVPEGEIFFVPEEAKDMIEVNFPKSGSKISSPLKVSGQARGYWFFEANAPMVLVNWDGLIIAEGYIEARSEWMTEDFVPFTGVLEFQKPDYRDNGALIIQRANPSDLIRNDAAVEIPIFFL